MRTPWSWKKQRTVDLVVVEVEDTLESEEASSEELIFIPRVELKYSNFDFAGTFEEKPLYVQPPGGHWIKIKIISFPEFPEGMSTCT